MTVMEGINTIPVQPHSPIDRRVQVIGDTESQDSSICRISELRHHPFLVLLGEPGSGKSTTLEIEASNEGVPTMKVRALMTGARHKHGTALFLDALDEYRADGRRADKTYDLAAAIKSTCLNRWRLTCRAEDWRKAADIGAIGQTTGGGSIVVAQLLPLNDQEAAALLTSFGENAPQQFLSRAYDFGAGGFLKNPLSLKLLHKAVSDAERVKHFETPGFISLRCKRC